MNEVRRVQNKTFSLLFPLTLSHCFSSLSKYTLTFSDSSSSPRESRLSFPSLRLAYLTSGSTQPKKILDAQLELYLTFLPSKSFGISFSSSSYLSSLSRSDSFIVVLYDSKSDLLYKLKLMFFIDPFFDFIDESRYSRSIINSFSFCFSPDAPFVLSLEVSVSLFSIFSFYINELLCFEF